MALRKESYYDELVFKLKNNKVIAVIILVFVVATSVYSFVSLIISPNKVPIQNSDNSTTVTNHIYNTGVEKKAKKI